MAKKKRAFKPKGAHGFKLKLGKGEKKVIYFVYTSPRRRTNFEIVRFHSSYQFQMREYWRNEKGIWKISLFQPRMTSGYWIELIMGFSATVKYIKSIEE